MADGIIIAAALPAHMARKAAACVPGRGHAVVVGQVSERRTGPAPLGVVKRLEHLPGVAVAARAVDQTPEVGGVKR